MPVHTVWNSVVMRRVIYSADDSADIVPPDTEFRYGSGQWQLAGGIAEVVSGRSWAELIDETYVEPCGLDVLAYTNHYLAMFVRGGSMEGAVAYPGFIDGDLANIPGASNPNMEGGGTPLSRTMGNLVAPAWGPLLQRPGAEPCRRRAYARGPHRRRLPGLHLPTLDVGLRPGLVDHPRRTRSGV